MGMTCPLCRIHFDKLFVPVIDKELQEAITKLRERVFDIAEPLVGLYNEVEELKALSIAAESELTEAQLVNIGVIKNMNYYKRGLETWLSQPVAARTWLDFKAHFTTAQDKL